MEVLIFFVLACAITWPMWFASSLSRPDAPWRMPCLVLGGSGPMLAATALRAAHDGWSGVAELYGTVLVIPSLREALIAVAVPLLLVLPGLALHFALRPGIASASVVDGRKSMYPNQPGLVLYCMLMAPMPLLLFEELGWRAYALPRLLRVADRTVASAILGVMWAGTGSSHSKTSSASQS